MKAKSSLITIVFTVAAASLSAHAADSAAAPSAAAIPFSEIGAKATADYKGDAIGIHSTADGAMLHTGFQKLEAEATREGLWIISTEDGGGRFRLRADSIGRASSDSQLPHSGFVSLVDKTVAFVRPGLTEEYSVSMDGVRQDFIVAMRPEGAGGLRVGLGLAGARAEAAAYGVKITVDGSGRELAYSRLQVTDATGKELTATMEVTGAVGITVCVDDAAAVYPIRIDPTFSDADWLSLAPSTAIPGVNGTVNAIVVQGANVYVGGSFAVAGNLVAARNIARWDGGAWSPLGTAAQNGAAGTVTVIAALSATEIYVGGSFTTVADSTGATISARNIAKWDSATNIWSPLGTATQNGAGNTVNAIAVVSASAVYVGGAFTSVADSTAASISANRIAKWNGSTWSLLGTATQNGATTASSSVFAITALSATNIYVGGSFTTVSDSSGPSISANRICKWNGTAWSPLGTATQNGAGGTVNAIATLSSTEIYVGGAFTTVADSSTASASVNRIAKWNGSTWSPLGTATQNGATSTVSAISALSSTEVYVAGSFTVVADSSTSSLSVGRIAKWNDTTARWSLMGSGVNTTVNALVAVSSTEVYLGGSFFTANSVAASGIAKWNGAGYVQMPPPGGGLNGFVNAMAISGIDLYIGGDFTLIGSVSAKHVARWNGSIWSPLGTATQNGTSTGFLGSVTSIAALSPAEIYVGGNFVNVADSTSPSISARNIAKWNSITNTWSRLGTSAQNGVNNVVSAIGALSSSEVYVGGQLTSAADSTSATISVNRVARWNGVTNTWSPLGTPTQNGANNFVFAIAPLSSTEIYIGGGFTTVSDSTATGISARNIAKWNSLTSTWAPLGTATQNGVNSSVSAIAALSSTDVYVGGGFTTVSDSTGVNLSANRIVKWNNATGTWSRLGTATQNGASSTVQAILAITPTEVYIGGAFITVADSTSASIPASRLAKWNGSAWSALGGGVNNTVRALSTDNLGQLFIGGDFVTAGTSPVTASIFLVQASNLVTIIAPDISLEQPLGSPIGDGGAKDFGTAFVDTPLSLTFNLSNPGNANLTGLGISIDGANASDFTITTAPGAPLSGGTGTTFTVRFAPATGGVKTAALRIANNVAGKNPYDITLSGQAYSFTTDTDADGLNDASEFQMAALGFDPAVAQPALVSALFNNASGAGLFTTSQVQTLNLPAPLIQRNFTTGQFTLELSLEKSADLLNFTPFPFLSPQTTINGQGKIQFQFTMPDNTQFFRLRGQ